MARRLAADHARQEQHYREIIARSAQEKQRAAERAKLQQRHLTLTKARHELDGLIQKRKEMEGSHRQMNAKLSELRDRRFRLRKEVAERLCRCARAHDPGLHHPGRRPLGLRGSAERPAQGLRPAVQPHRRAHRREFVSGRTVAHRSEGRCGAPRRGWRYRRRSGEFGSSVICQDSDQIGKLETVDLEDEPLIALKDGADFKNSADLSTGQRCTVILPILLLESERPLLIDQPEDNLDNAFVYDTIVKSLRDAKGGRQLIFVTHNPEHSRPRRGGKGVRLCLRRPAAAPSPTVGTVEDVKGQIEHLLEGGKEAFVLRMHKYGH